jgi:hypothetical protein
MATAVTKVTLREPGFGDLALQCNPKLRRLVWPLIPLELPIERGSVATGQQRKWGYLVMWEFEVKPGMEARFEEIYGPSGDWERLFGQDENYLKTELNRAQGPLPRYITLDFWTSEEAYENFRERHHFEYEAIDRQCDQLRASERKLAAFVRFEPKTC